MNQELADFARDYLKKGLAELTEGNRDKFRMMYAYGPGCRDWETARRKPIEQVVDEMPVDKLSWAMEQVKNTLARMQPAVKTYEHSPVCNGDRKKPPGTPGSCCSCLNALRRFTREELNAYMESRMDSTRIPGPWMRAGLCL